MSMLWVCVSLLGVFQSCAWENSLRRENSAGDIIIGGLFSIHLQTNRTDQPGSLACHDFDIQSFLQSQVMIYAIEEINRQTPKLLPNFNIGYDIYDTCGDVSLAIKATLQLLELKSQTCGLTEGAQSLLGDPETKVVIGEQSSEVSIAVARIVSLASVAQISHAATSELLSSKHKFPTFLRTVSSDEHQTAGIGKLVSKFNWKSVAIVGSDDEYGRFGSDRLNEHFMNGNVCIEFMEILPGYFSQNTTKSQNLQAKLLDRINTSTAEAIILFTKDTNVEIIIEAAIKGKFNKTWIASDTWSTSIKISTLPNIQFAGQVFGFTYNGQEVPGFRQYLMSQLNQTIESMAEDNPFCKEQDERNITQGCVQTSNQQCLNQTCLEEYIDKDYSYSVYLAVGVIADSLKRLMKCDNLQCERTSGFTAFELLEAIKKVNCTVNTTRIFFDSHGDPNLGYAIMYWNTTDQKIKKIGEYWPNGSITVPEDLEKDMTAPQVTIYGCLKTCGPGHELKIPDKEKKCCGYCVSCVEGDYSPGNGTPCEKCGDKQYSIPAERDKCLNITDEYLKWSSSISIALSCFAVLGIIITVLFAVQFFVYQGTPIAKAVGGYLVFFELLSLLTCFCLTFNFLGKPTTDSCRTGLPLFGMAFSLCIACILANLLQILVCFDFNMTVASWMKKMNRFAVVVGVWGIQLTLSVLWMILDPPVRKETEIHPHNVHTCELQPVGFFAAMIAYLGFWALVCFLFAFKGRTLPDLYKNAVLISVSMLLILIIWIIFIPLFLNLKGNNKSAVEIVAILISCYSILGFHLAPKCYIMTFRKELNNEKAITEHIKMHYEQQGRSVITCPKTKWPQTNSDQSHSSQ